MWRAVLGSCAQAHVALGNVSGAKFGGHPVLRQGCLKNPGALSSSVQGLLVHCDPQGLVEAVWNVTLT